MSQPLENTYIYSNFFYKVYIRYGSKVVLVVFWSSTSSGSSSVMLVVLLEVVVVLVVKLVVWLKIVKYFF